MNSATGTAGPTDAELVAGVLAADHEAFAAVYDKYGNKLYDFAYSMLRQREDAADAAAARRHPAACRRAIRPLNPVASRRLAC